MRRLLVAAAVLSLAFSATGAPEAAAVECSPTPWKGGYLAPPPTGGDDSALLTACIAAVPDGSFLRLVENATYISEDEVVIPDRVNFQLQGRNATLRATSLVGDQDPGPKVDGREHLSIIDGSGITVQNLHIESANTGCTYSSEFEFEAGIEVQGAENVLLDHVTVHAVGGDGLEVNEHNDFQGAPTERAANVTARDSSFTCIGRQGMSVSDVNGLTILRDTFDDVARTGFDFEPIRASAIIENVYIGYSTFTDFRNLLGGGAGTCCNLQRNVVIEYNTATWLLFRVGFPMDQHDGIPDRVNWTFRGNIGLETIPRTSGITQTTAFALREADQVLVEGNTQPFVPGRPDTIGVDASSSTNVTVTGNNFQDVATVCLGC